MLPQDISANRDLNLPAILDKKQFKLLSGAELPNIRFPFNCGNLTLLRKFEFGKMLQAICVKI